MSARSIIFSVLAICCALLADAQPKAKWIIEEHDFGMINENDGDATCVFKLVNTGNEPLVIINARATCGCTTPKYTEEQILPGDTADIMVSYDPLERPGRFKKKVYIDTNTDPKRSTLTISGVVIASERTVKMNYPVDAGGPLRLRRSIISLGEVYKGKSKTDFIDAYNNSEDTIYPLWVNVPDYYTVMSAPKAVPPGQQVTFTFYLNTLKCNTWGRIADTLAVAASPGITPFKMLAVATINENFSRMTPGERKNAPAIAISQQHVDLGIISSADGIITRQIKIENFGKDALLLRRIYTDTENDEVAVTVSKDKLKKGKTATATISIDASKINGEYLNARITVISNDPERARSVIRVTAEVKN